VYSTTYRLPYLCGADITVMSKGQDGAHENESVISNAEMPGLCDASDSDGECARVLCSLLSDDSDEDLPDMAESKRPVVLDIFNPLAANHRRRALWSMLGLPTEDADLVGQMRDFLSRHFGTRARDDVDLLNQLTSYLHDHPDDDF
jgi:hypothetical protein